MPLGGAPSTVISHHITSWFSTPSPLVPQQMLDRSEAALASTPQDKARQRSLQAASHLVHAFDVVRIIFGSSRAPCVRPKAEVVTELKEKSAQRGGTSLEEADMQVGAGRGREEEEGVLSCAGSPNPRPTSTMGCLASGLPPPPTLR